MFRFQNRTYPQSHIATLDWLISQVANLPDERHFEITLIGWLLSSEGQLKNKQTTKYY